MKSSFLHRFVLCALGMSMLAAVPASAQETKDEWPLVFTVGGDEVQVFKPQPESFDGTAFTARAAVALQRPQDDTPVFGAIWGNGVLAVDRTSRMGKLTAFKVTDARFPGITDADERTRIMEMLSAGITDHAAPIAIDWLVSALEEEQQSTASYDNSPPTIYYRDQPSILLFIDGEPIFEPVKQDVAEEDPVYARSTPEVERIVNTPFLVMRPKGGDLWLYGSGQWYTSASIQGPWKNKPNAPSYLERIAAEVDTTATSTASDSTIPQVVVSTKPAILLAVNGSPRMEPFQNSSLMFVTNANKNLFLYIPDQEYFMLASGRWYATKDLRNGPWRYVAPDALPADFAKVPEGSSKDGILAHVSGTPAALEAVRDASIPQTAVVDRGTTSIQVTYQGAPRFEQIAGTEVYSAQNASTTVLRINGMYHVCDNAVWYEGTTPDGPWTVSTYRPAEVNDIPPSDPAYRVRYVYIYDHTPDVVYVGYTPGYLGSYVQAGTVIYGTGYYYNPWYGGNWYPRPYTWGFNMHYNPWYGWSFGSTWGYHWFYPSWFHYGYRNPYSWGWWGPYAYCPNVVDWDHHGYYGHRNSMAEPGNGNSRPVGSASAARGTDLYRNHEKAGVRPTTVERNVERKVDQNRTVETRPAKNTATTNRTPQVDQRDIYTDRSGNVYRNTDGRLETYRNGNWSKVQNTREGSTLGRQDQSKAPGNDRGGTVTRPDVQRTVPQRTFPQRTPQRQPATNPQQIARERMRGEQRARDFQQFQQNRRNTPTQPRSTTPTHRKPTHRSTPSTPTVRPSAPKRSAPSSSPSRSTGGNSGRRTPR